MEPYLNSFFSLFYPNCCLQCGDDLSLKRKYLCTNCENSLPRTNFHFYKDNPIERLLAGKIPAEIRVTAFCFYKKKSIIQKLIHRLKYKDDYRVGTYFGYLFGMDLQQEKTFNSIDIIVPVPLHPDKLKLRGYNQSEAIAKGIAMVMHKTIDISSLVRIKRTKTQTKKDIHERAVNMVDAFQLKETDNLKRKHILLVDDVITTGATIETATKTLLSIPDVKISIACLACGNS